MEVKTNLFVNSEDENNLSWVGHRKLENGEEEGAFEVKAQRWKEEGDFRD